jgi:hypothetical protein
MRIGSASQTLDKGKPGRKIQSVLSSHWVQLLGISSVLVISAGVSWIRTSSGQEQARLWRAIGAIYPRISNSGDTIVFSYQGAIWKIPRQGGVMTRLTHTPGFDIEPAWSPNGKRIAYINSSNEELNLIDSASGASIRLPAKVLAQGKLFFHPDGHRLLGNFRSQNAGAPSALAWLDLEKGNLVPLLDPSRSLDVYALSPDGERVAFIATQDVQGEQEGHNGPEVDIWTCSLKGGKPEKLDRFRSRIFDLMWSGRDLYFSTDWGGAHNDLWVLPFENPSQAIKLTSGQADEDHPSLSADGRWLVYTDNRENATALVVRDLNSGEESTLGISRLEFGQPTGTVHLVVVDKESREPLVARVSLQQKDGKYFAPLGSLYRIHANLEHFYFSHGAAVTVPAGKFVVQAFHGTEYRVAKQEFELSPGENRTVALELQRWIDPAKNSWYSGESHIHANYGYGHWYNTPESMRLQLEGEGLNVANFMVANSDTDGVFDREFFRGSPDPHSAPKTILYWNEEFRATLWGHMTLLDLRQLVEPIFTGFQQTTNPWDTPTNADIADQTHLQHGLVNYTHPAENLSDPFLSAYSAKSVPVEVALGKIDSLDINWGEATLLLWYRLLNCGFHLPASAGTDCFLNRIRSRLPGSDRAYVKIDGAFSYREWVDGLRSGRSFVTNGPILEFGIGDKSLGETVHLSKPDAVPVRATVRSQFPLSRVELVYNGDVITKGLLAPDRLSGHIEQPVRIAKSGWLSFRAYGDDASQAHSGPIYVEVSGTPIGSRKDAEYFLQWIERLESKLNARDRIPSAELKARVSAQLNAARSVYRQIAAERE